MNRKQYVTLLLSLSFFSFSKAQFIKTKSVGNAGFSDSINAVVSDFRSNFYHIQGNELVPQGLVNVYQSKVGLPGSSHCIIQRYHSKEDTSASWQAVMYDGESQQEALKIYKNTYKELRKVKIRWAASKAASFTGEMEAPDENVRFTSTELHLETDDDIYKQFYAVVEITSNYSGWEVHLNLHKRKDDDEKY